MEAIILFGENSRDLNFPLPAEVYRNVNIINLIILLNMRLMRVFHRYSWDLLNCFLTKFSTRARKWFLYQIEGTSVLFLSWMSCELLSQTGTRNWNCLFFFLCCPLWLFVFRCSFYVDPCSPGQAKQNFDTGSDSVMGVLVCLHDSLHYI